MSEAGPILFYDGECGMCQCTVRWCLEHDRRGRLRFAPLQGETFSDLKHPHKPTKLDSIVLWDGRTLRVRSDAFRAALAAMGRPWRLIAAMGRLCPRRIGDALYDFVAARRYRWFGGAEACRLPPPGMKARFLP